ncbi:hypothetical protein MJO28_014016 [Puccinia striiformis f. sp. tritici]|uniref:Uncharacterized protein n=1 Tax=Puccinia striiformis f. sp. tritici TaxID=168172 RepID=A0ACC0DY37_9BASI|nr:hypothetical protein MJO28_014016 [Puccinia striiformis f. sp. tritici]KAI7941785.1 hypothetical protein MJO29_013859 [Puccinia striiformis f. sp. tritici]
MKFPGPAWSPGANANPSETRPKNAHPTSPWIHQTKPKSLELSVSWAEPVLEEVLHSAESSSWMILPDPSSVTSKEPSEKATCSPFSNPSVRPVVCDKRSVSRWPLSNIKMAITTVVTTSTSPHYPQSSMFHPSLAEPAARKPRVEMKCRFSERDRID